MMKIKPITLFKPLLLTLAFTWLAVNPASAQSKLPPLLNSAAKESTAPKTQPPSRLKIMQEQLRAKYSNRNIKVAADLAPKKTTKETYYIFTGKGSWYTASNWKDNLVPPDALQQGSHIIIDCKGYCLLSNKSLLVITKGSSIEVKPGKTLYVSIGNNLVFNGGLLTNNGTVKILSGVLNTKTDKQPGNIQTTRFSKVAFNKPVTATDPGKGIK